MTTGVPTYQTLSDHDLFTRVNNTKPLTFSQSNFDSSTKQQQQQLIKGSSLMSFSSDSVDPNDSINGHGATRRKVHTTSPPHDTPDEFASIFNKNTQSKVKFRKQTLDIAAKAAQKRANLHHKQVMEDMGK